jgi:hypothetical protein
MAKKITNIQTVRNPRNFALAHAFKGVSYVASWENDHDLAKPPTVTRLKSDADKLEHLMENVCAGDSIYLENGGANDRLMLFMLAKGARVLAFPTFILGNKDAVADFLQGTVEWKIADERAVVDESSEELTSRKRRALAIMLTAVLDVSKFREFQADDRVTLLLKHNWRMYQVSQRILSGNYLRLLGSMNDRYILQSASSGQYVKHGQVATASLFATIDALLERVPVDQRDAFKARIGLERFESKVTVSRKAAEDLFRAVVREMIENDQEAHGPFLSQMSGTKKEIERALKKHPIYTSVFDPIPGCGPLVSVRIMTAIVDINRFASPSQLKAYAGYHHFPDGTRARRVKGRAFNVNQDLKQGVWQWTQQTIKLTSSPWRTKLDQRRAYELVKLLRDRQQKANELDLDVEILPVAFSSRSISCVNDVTVADLEFLAKHIDQLRERAGVKTDFSASDDEDDADDAETTSGDESESTDNAEMKKLAPLVRGLKMTALNKAYRWLGQKMLEHIHAEWKKAIAPAVASEEVAA